MKGVATRADAVIKLPATLVLDCTVCVPWYLTDEASELTETLFAALGRTTFVVPVLWRLEFISAMRAAFRRGCIPSERLPTIFAQAVELPLQQEALLLDVAQIAAGCEEYALTPYDYVYLAVARARDVPLATFDGALLRACARAGVSVLTERNRIAEPGQILPLKRKSRVGATRKPVRAP